MRRLFHLATFVLLAAWLPATMHCGLEAMVDFAAEHCDHHDSEEGGAAGAHFAVENGSYRATPHPITVVAPLEMPGWCGPALQVIPPADAVVGARDVGESPAGLARTWQFTTRAALPANAPSFVS